MFLFLLAFAHHGLFLSHIVAGNQAQTDNLLAEQAQLAGRAELSRVLLAVDRAAQGTLDRRHRAVVLEWLQRGETEVAIDLVELCVQLLVEAELDSVSARLREASIVLLVLWNDVGLGGEEASRLEVDHELCEVRSRYEVLQLVVALHGVLVREVLVPVVHPAERHIACQLGYAHLLLRVSGQDPAAFQLDPHGGDVLDQLAYERPGLRLGLLAADDEKWHSLQAVAEYGQGALELCRGGVSLPTRELLLQSPQLDERQWVLGDAE